MTIEAWKNKEKEKRKKEDVGKGEKRIMSEMLR